MGGGGEHIYIYICRQEKASWFVEKDIRIKRSDEGVLG